jgi:hypothetical protein
VAGGPKMPKVKEIFVSFKIDLAKGEHLNFSSLKTRSSAKEKPRIPDLAQKSRVLTSK